MTGGSVSRDAACGRAASPAPIGLAKRSSDRLSCTAVDRRAGEAAWQGASAHRRACPRSVRSRRRLAGFRARAARHAATASAAARRRAAARSSSTPPAASKRIASDSGRFAAPSRRRRWRPRRRSRRATSPDGKGSFERLVAGVGVEIAVALPAQRRRSKVTETRAHRRDRPPAMPPLRLEREGRAG